MGRFAPGFFGGGGPALEYVGSVIRSAQSTFSPVTHGNGEAGDLMIVVSIAVGSTSSPPTVNTPSGWTHIANNGGDFGAAGRYAIKYRRLTGSETGSINFWSGQDASGYIITRFRGEGAISTGLLNNPPLSDTGNPPPQTVAIASNSIPAPVIVFGIGFGISNAINPFPMSPAAQYDSGARDPEDLTGVTVGGGLRVKYCYFNPGDTIQDVTVDMDDEGNRNGMTSGYIRIGD